MTSKFIYLTKKRAISIFLLLQLFPILIIADHISFFKKIGLWLGFEVVIIGLIFLWQLKPVKEFDEREKSIVLKWKGRIIDHGLSVFMIPLITICMYPDTEAWTLYYITAIPAYIVFTIYHILMKRELGYFFYES